MRPAFGFLPEAKLAGRADLLAGRQRAHAPVSSTLRKGMDRGFHDGGFLVVRNPPGAPPSRSVRKKPGQPCGLVPLPLQRHGCHCPGSLPCEKVVRSSFGRIQDEVHPETNSSGNAVLAERHPWFPVCIPDRKWGAGGRGIVHPQCAAALAISHFRRAFSWSSLLFNCSSFCPASPSLPSAVSRW
jgi:hypothetical protein